MNGPIAPRSNTQIDAPPPVWSQAALETFPDLESQVHITAAKKRSGLGWREFFSRLGNGSLPRVKTEA